MPDATQSRNGDASHSRQVAAFLELHVVDWTVALMLASLLEPMSAGALEIEIHKAHLKREDGDSITERQIAASLKQLVTAGIAIGDHSHFIIELELSHRLVGAAALQTDGIPKPPTGARRKTKVPKALPDLTGADRRQRFEAICFHVLRESGIHPFGFFGLNRDMHELREIRALYWLGEMEDLNERLEENESYFDEDVARLFVRPIAPERFDRLSFKHQAIILETCLVADIDQLLPCGELLDELCRLPCATFVWRTMAEAHLLRGESAQVEKIITILESGAASKSTRSNSRESGEWHAESSQLRGCVHFAKGENDLAIAEFEACVAFLKGNSRRKKLCPRGLGALFFVLALCRQQTPEAYQQAAQYAKWGRELKESAFAVLLDFAEDITACLAAPSRQLEQRISAHRNYYLHEEAPNLNTLLFIMLSRLTGESADQQQAWDDPLDELVESATGAGFHWLAWEAATLRNDLPGTEQDQRTGKLLKLINFAPVAFSTAIRPVERWQISLQNLEKIADQFTPKSAPDTTAEKSDAARRQLIWILDSWLPDEPREPAVWELHPVERTISKAGRASKGKSVSVRKLKERPETVTSATAQDLRVGQFAHQGNGWDHRASFDIFSAKALLALAGHPHIYTDRSARQPIELIHASPRIDLTETADGSIQLRIVPDVRLGSAPAVLVHESPTRLIIYEIKPVHRQLEQLLEDSPTLTIPASERDRLLAAITTLSAEIDVGADEALGDSTHTDAEAIEGDPLPHLRLLPGGRGLDARLLVRPVPGSRIDPSPGEGKAVLFAAVETQRYQASRDLSAEIDAAESVIEHCPTLRQHRGEHPDPWQWHFEDPNDCLQLLTELHALDESQIHVEWPEGQPLRVVASADTRQLRLSLATSSNGDWLKAAGDLEVSDDLVISMRKLLKLLDSDDEETATAARRGFVKVGDSEYLALSENLQRQLADLHAAASIGGQPDNDDDDNDIQIHPLAALALQDLTRDANIGNRMSKIWREQLARIDAARDHHPDPPASLRAELRPYQLDGYRWLSRLAILGAGACLADDMGLGKTVQALALIIERAPLGPSLVIAPTSVAANWINETARFAPTLKPLRFGDGDRAAMLDDLAPGDLVILSYGLLHTEIKKLAVIEWNTIILDEAQAIKNRTTQRSKAAMKLQAGMRIITTGTPVENRLAELHNLFHFINPGLLGSWRKFQEVFADPIENDNVGKAVADSARTRLRRLIQPFLLRRLKSEVLRDLPPRTEIELSVEASDGEIAFYEALRQKAIEDIESAEPGSSGAIRILAQLTRLRRACCHPRLIDPDSEISSSKLAVFADTLEEILGGDHKVLVFSQFVDHLTIVREHLEAEGISYQYLDGSTPTKKRQQAVDAFQSGDGDVFLISLKAGGFGLNLTAADYVIHLDPWWNPAAEDQASDRAHRIGQQRPVTVYRLIVRDTIEEKIVALHHRKRDLADSLLEGTGKAAKLSPDDMLELLRS